MSGKANKLVEQQEALGAFFDSLMRDVEAFAESEVEHSQPTPAAVPVPQVVKPVAVSSPSPAPASTPRLPSSKPVAVKTPTPSIFEVLPPLAPPKVVVPNQPAVSEAPPAVKPAEPKAKPAPEPGKAVPPAPTWLGKQLQAMLFKVAGLTLAVPLVDLNGVVEWDGDKLTAMPGHADFYLGLMTHLNRQVPVVDTARLVLPENKLKLLGGEDPCQRISRVVLIQDGRYGLACDEVNEVVTLKADAVRWRSERTQRRWLAGTVIEHMCALIDATAFAELLANRAPVEAFRE